MVPKGRKKRGPSDDWDIASMAPKAKVAVCHPSSVFILPLLDRGRKIGCSDLSSCERERGPEGRGGGGGGAGHVSAQRSVTR